jgi:hypothetical protein
MKIMIYFLLSILFLTPLIANASNFALVNDKDGYVNVRSSPSITSNIETTLKNDEIVLCASTDDSPNFCLVNFKNDNVGFIYKSRLNFFKNYKKVSLVSYTPKKVIYKSGNISIEIIAKIVNKNIKYKAKNNVIFLNDKEVYGVDGNIPNDEFLVLEKISINDSGNITTISEENLKNFVFPYEGLSGKNEMADFNIYISDKKIYILNVFNNGGAGEYSLVFYIENGILKKKIAWHNTLI